jgi:hypothetical protein
MKDLLGYEFFTVKDGVPLEFDPAYGQEYAQLYNQNVAKLAWQVAQLLKTLEAEGSASDRNGKDAGSKPQASSKPAVYLAECSYDRKQERELIDGELKRLGYPVLPDKQLPADEAEYVAAVESMLARCALSIHLVGERYGAVPDGPTAKSTGMLQNELAVARCKSGGLKRLIWLPQGTCSQQAPQQAFIEALHQDAQAQFGADLIAGAIEELRVAIHATLKKIEQPESQQPELDATGAPATGGESRKLIYLICDQKDLKAAVPLRKFAGNLGLRLWSRLLRAMPPRFAKPASRLWRTATPSSCIMDTATRHGSAPSIMSCERWRATAAASRCRPSTLISPSQKRATRKT